MSAPEPNVFEMSIGPRVHGAVSIAREAGLPVLLEGPTGIGKSQIIEEVARLLGIEVRIIDLSLLEPSDLVGLPTMEDGRTTYALPSILPRSGSGILLFEELNRAEPYLQNPALQLLTARRLHEYVLPDGWMVVAAINPEGGEYRVNALDKALRARFMVLKLRADRDRWLEWSVANNVHPAIVHTVGHHENAFKDVSPRSWDYASKALHALEAVGASFSDGYLLRDALGGLLPFAWVEVVRRLLLGDEKARSVNPRDVLLNYAQDADLMNFVRDMKELGRTDALDAIASGVRALVQSDELGRLIEGGAFQLESLEMFMHDLPGDLAESIREAFAENPASGRAIDVSPVQALRGYGASTMRRQVERWLCKPDMWHRVGALMQGVAAYVRGLSQEELDLVRNRRPARKSLGRLLERVGAKRGAPLIKALEALDIAVIRPGRKSS